MPPRTKVLDQILSGRSDANVGFNDLLGLVCGLGFEERTRGSNHIFTRDGVAEIINLRPKGAKAKAYQVKQVRHVILKYRLGEIR